jgi:Mu transposase, C-terminal
LGKWIMESLRIQIENTSPGRGELDLMVERRFGVVPAIFKQWTPGYVKPDFGTRGARDYRLDSALDLTEFRRSSYSPSFSTTARRWGHRCAHGDDDWRNVRDATQSLDLGIANRSGSLRMLGLEDVALAVMPMDSARVTAKGIRFKGGYYTSDTAEAAGWFVKARLKGEWSVTVSYDARSLDKLYILDPGTPLG